MEQIIDSSSPVRRKPLRHGHRGAAAKVHGKSSITNGKTLLPTASGSSIWARIMKDTLGSLVAHCGGVDVISETKRLAARRVSVLEAELIYLEDKIAFIRQHGDEPDPALVEHYGRLADRQRRQSESLGWNRTAREVGMSLGDLMMQAVSSPPASADDGTAIEVVPIEKDAPAAAAEAPAPVAEDDAP
jgi:hypothetical protein